MVEDNIESEIRRKLEQAEEREKRASKEYDVDDIEKEINEENEPEKKPEPKQIEEKKDNSEEILSKIEKQKNILADVRLYRLLMVQNTAEIIENQNKIIRLLQK